MLVGLLTSKRNMPKVTVTDRDTVLMKSVAKFLLKTDHVLCYFRIEKNVKSRCITDCRVNAKPTKAKVVGKYAKEADDDKHCELAKNSFAIAWLTFKDEVYGPFPLFLVAGYVTPIIACIILSLIIQLFILSHLSHIVFM
jgi:hypothetical protein